VAVLLVDASATSVLVAIARGARGRPSAGAFSGVAAAATASLLPGIAAVLREVRAHGSAAALPHRMRPTVLLLLAGMLITTAGALLVLPSTASVEARGSAARRADLLLLVGGDLIGVPYLVVVSALHRGDRG
jgi:hypothetical protein